MYGEDYYLRNPYSGECRKHGRWDGPIDECPKCMKESDLLDIPPSFGICHHCKWADGDEYQLYCQAPKWNIQSLPMKPYRKKACKYYAEMTQNDWDWLEQPWGRT